VRLSNATSDKVSANARKIGGFWERKFIDLYLEHASLALPDAEGEPRKGSAQKIPLGLTRCDESPTSQAFSCSLVSQCLPRQIRHMTMGQNSWL